MVQSIRAFLAGLPAGVDSHPEALVRGSVVQAWIEDHDLDSLREALGPFPAALATLEATGSSWVGAVPATIVYLAVRERFFSSDGDYVRAAFGKNAGLLQRPIYRPLFATVGKERLVRWAPRAFALVHRGTTVSVDDRGHAIEVTYDYPQGLIPPLIARCHATAISALLDTLGLSAVIDMESHGPTQAVFHASLATSRRPGS